EFARVLLGVIKGDAETVVDLCAVKLPRNVYRPGALHEASGWSNPMIEDRWAQEAARLAQLERSSRFVPRWIRPASASDPDGRLAPLLLCRTGRRFFSPPCPRCGGALETCRDDARLGQAGLPLFSGSLERFLQCRACAEESPDAPFYAFEVSPELAGKGVLSAADLARDLGEALAGTGPEADRLQAAFPCPDCVRAGEEFRASVASGARPRPFWEDRWAPLTFSGGPFLVTGLDPFDLDEFADLLGGRPPDTLWTGKPGAAALAAAAREQKPSALESGAGRPRWLFEGDSSGSDAVELFAVKLAAFRQVVQAALEYSRALGRPHLDLHPRHLLFDLARIGEGLPLFWNFQMRLHGISTAARVERLAGAADVVIPPRNPAVPYAPPEVLEFHLTPPRPAQLVLTEVEDEKRPAAAVRLHGLLSDPYGIFPNPRVHDWILLTLDNEALGLRGFSIACRRDPRAAEGSRELAFISEPVAVGDDIAQRLKKAAGVRIPGVRYKVYADFGAPSDIYSLGMILLRLLVGNDRQDVRTIAQIVERVAKKISAAGEVTIGNVESPGGASALLDREPDILAALNKTNVFYQEIDRRPERANGIPDPLWKRAILLAMRLVTRVQGFSFCAHPADYDDVHPFAKIEAVLQETDLLGQQLRSLLFNRQGINLEIQQVLSEVLAEKSLGEKEAPA
ncbi:MAG: hypothetical protein M3R62_15475, partial [Acidobacteriota bacterium]|nr:hypothetical protein [Acidobacteriota bacterium]